MSLTRSLIVLVLVLAAATFVVWHGVMPVPHSAAGKRHATVAITAAPVTISPTTLPRRERPGNRAVVAGPLTPPSATPMGRPTPRHTHGGQPHHAIAPDTTPTPSATPPATARPTAAATARPPAQAAGSTPAMPVATPPPHSSLASFDPTIPSATIVIPRLGVRAPVYERGLDSTRNLPIAPGYAVTHYHFSALLGQRGNYVIYGHDDIEGQIFRYLPTMRVGDRVYLNSQGHRYTYRVTGSSIVSPDDVAVMTPTPDATLTMISCTPYWVDTQRIVVTATLI